MSISTTAMSVSLHHHVRIGRSFTFFSCNAPPRISSSQLLCLATGSGSNSGETEVSLWLREEQRWLREEQRWLREESRWITERESLLREISTLRLRVQQLESKLERRDSLSDSLSQIASLLQTTICLPSSQADPLVPPRRPSFPSLPPQVIEQQEAKELKKDDDLIRQAKATNPRRKALRIGSEGEEVREMQEALLKLGFYSGEEDMEYSSFSSGTQRAVKTWQATLGAPEDGIMTEELLNRLYLSQQTDISGSPIMLDEPGAENQLFEGFGTVNGASTTSVAENTEIQQTVTKKEGMSELEASERVYLIGENRWEDPSRLVGNDKQADMENAQDSSRKCLACRGEGRLMCMECDGTGEPNIEPQFVEWADEGAKCPYCEGLGYTICDMCIEKSTV